MKIFLINIHEPIYDDPPYRTAQSSGALFPYQYCLVRWISPQFGQSITDPLHANLANPIQEASFDACVVILTTTFRPFKWHRLHRYTLFSYWFWYRQHFELWWSLRLLMWPMDNSQRSSHDIHCTKHVKYCSGNGLNDFSVILPENFRFNAYKNIQFSVIEMEIMKWFNAFQPLTSMAL